jgi:hypothetical protein
MFLFLLLTAVAAQPPGSGSTDICSVCLEDLALVSSTVTLECAHTLCLECYTGIYNTQRAPSCPLCRAPCLTSPANIDTATRPTAAPTATAPPPQPQPLDGGSNGATTDGWETIPPELLMPAPTRMPCTPSPQPSVTFDYDVLWEFLRVIFYIIDTCMRVRR